MSLQRRKLNWDRVRPYLDDDIAERVERVRPEIDDAVAGLVDEFKNQAREMADKLAEGDIAAQFDESIASVRQSLDDEMKSLEQRLESVRAAASKVKELEDESDLSGLAKTLADTAKETQQEIDAFREKVRTFGSRAGQRLGGVALKFITGGIG